MTAAAAGARPEVVVGVDGSSRDAAALDAALDAALREAAAGQWRVRAVRAQGGRGRGDDPPAWPPGERAAVEQAVQAALARRAEAGASTAEVSLELAAGAPGPALIAAGKGAALIVVGDRARGPVQSALLGSTTRQVVHESCTPVLVVPQQACPPGPVGRVVVGVDGSAPARSAVTWAGAAARRHGCPLLLLNAWVITALPERKATGYIPSLAEFGELAGAWLDEQASAMAAELTDLQVQTHTVHGSAPEALMRATGPQDLIVVGSRGQGGFSSLVLGSVADQVVRHSDTPVVVVRAG